MHPMGVVAVIGQAIDTVRCYKPITIVTDKALCYAKVIKEMNRGSEPQDAIRHINRKHLNNRIEGAHGALKPLLRPKCGFRSLTAANNTPPGSECNSAS